MCASKMKLKTAGLRVADVSACENSSQMLHTLPENLRHVGSHMPENQSSPAFYRRHGVLTCLAMTSARLRTCSGRWVSSEVQLCVSLSTWRICWTRWPQQREEEVSLAWWGSLGGAAQWGWREAAERGGRARRRCRCWRRCSCGG